MADSSVDIDNSCTLRNLPLPARVLIAAFLLTIGVGYVSALVQLHMQHASPGEVLPTGEDVVHAYHGSHGVSVMERLVVSRENLPFNGSGTMRPAFTFRSVGWPGAVDRKAEAMKLNPEDDADRTKAEKELRKERDLEIDTLLEWIRKSGQDEDSYKEFVVSEALASRFPEDLDKLGKNMFSRNDKMQVVASVETIVGTRCARCHNPRGGGAQGEIHLNKFNEVLYYLIPEHGGGMAITKLAQSTHVHLLGFGMLYGLTGIIFSLTSYPVLVRILLAPFPLIMQVIDIACWWLARLPDPNGPMFAQVIPVTGGLVALGLMAHIVLSAFNLFGAKGKAVLVLLFLAGGALAGLAFLRVIDPYLIAERLQAAAGN